MYFLTILTVLLCYFVHFSSCKETKTFLANENRQGYGEELLMKTINKHFPDSDITDKTVLAGIVGSRKGQLVLRNAAVNEMKKKMESEKGRNFLDEPLDDQNYCNFDWLSWLPWLTCPEKTRKASPLRYYEKLCNPHQE